MIMKTLKKAQIPAENEILLLSCGSQCEEFKEDDCTSLTCLCDGGTNNSILEEDIIF